MATIASSSITDDKESINKLTPTILLEYAAPFLDRMTWHNLSIISKEFQQESNFVLAPWPDGQFRISSGSRVYTIAFSPDDSIGYDNRCKRLNGFENIGAHEDDDGFRKDNDNKKRRSGTMAIGCYDGSVYIWNCRTRYYKLLENLRVPIAHITYAQKANLLVALSFDGRVRLWTYDDRNNYQRCKVEPNCHQNLVEAGGITSMAVSPDGQTIVMGYRHTINTHKIRLWKLPTTIANDTLNRENVDCDISEQDLSPTSNETILTGEGLWVKSICFAPDGRTMASISGPQCIRYWDLQSCSSTALDEAHSNRVNGITFSPDGEHLASSSDDGTIRLWSTFLDPLDVTQHRSTMVLPHPGKVRSIAFTPNGTSIVSYATCSNTKTGMVRVWNLDDGSCSREFHGPENTLSLSISPDGQVIVFVCFDGSIAFQPLR